MKRKRLEHREERRRTQYTEPPPRIPPPFDDDEDDDLEDTLDIDEDADYVGDDDEEVSESENAELWDRWLKAHQR